MYISGDKIIYAASVIGALAAFFSIVLYWHRWYLRQCQQDKEIKQLKEEQCLLVYGVLACLKGLKEQGCNGPVTEAINKIEKHINQQAHE